MANDSIQQISVFIYGLIDPRDGQLRYVGKTKNSLKSRLLAHVSDVRRGRTYIPRHKWLCDLLLAGEFPEIVELDRVASDAWQEAEQFWIGYLRFVGLPLLNGTIGGDGTIGHKMSEEIKKKLSDGATKRYQNPNERRRTGAAVKRGQDTDSYRAYMRERAAKCTPESLAKLHEGTRRYCRSEEGRKAIADRMRGKVVSEATRKILSEQRLGVKLPIETRLKMAASRLGRKHSEATKAKMRAAINRDASSLRTRERWLDPEYVAKQAAVNRSAKLKSKWADPMWRAERLERQRAARAKT
ncbi:MULTISPECIES: NUMOD3 domain-containing DNA-binding protein [Mesorhizobium]|uniref:NUMOD3 domain-containing DNA-binding protein n=1 Tax=Mesorhizobium TaxID=68287 RepID=UPI0007A93DFB|nr:MULTISPECIES: NUMOD3 domain-containing DNA-binding protein [Mesorhizobium]AMX93637.1 hypothetical protein A4R28_11270 [Mesorhizobium ciceri]MDF3208328.1 NUMOD3 domain-containing DNA-binding protein [Mesorhizobium sp. LMG15046]MDF3229100.1 NUMOD3 domain-containing DNA-binding protein [Mesorhizobium sp. DSM 30133]RUU22209.1 hypothetical protein EOC84_03620 [Mesorhizobium sp. Primo-B]RUU37881.1 hypothetical protein EOC83_16595 [Mesorhizobium sp. Primo-A]